MKNCPKCKLDYADYFSYCEFDGTQLTKVSLPKGASLLNTFPVERVKKAIAIISSRGSLQIICVVILLLGALLLIGKPGKNQLQASAANRNQQTNDPVFIETPQSARDYSENDTKSAQGQDNQRPDKPGVVVIKPETTTGKNSNPSPDASSSAPSSSRKPVLKRPQRTEIDSPTVRNSESTRQATRPEQQPENETIPAPQPRAPQIRAAQVPPTKSSNSQIAVNRRADFEQSVGNDAISLSLIHVRSYRTDFGIRYELTLNMQHQGARLVRWERLTLATHSLSGINRSETIPFYQRLAANGSMNFTISIEMRGRDTSDLQGRLTCIAMGEDVEGKAIRAVFNTHVSAN